MSEEERAALAERVRTYIQTADDETVRIISAMVGLLACTAYADREYAASERDQVRQVLCRINGLSPAGVDAIVELLDARIVQLTLTDFQGYLRDLRELADPDTLLQILEALMELAAADDAVSTAETNLLRRAASGLGLSADDYNAVQARYRHKLSVLKR